MNSDKSEMFDQLAKKLTNCPDATSFIQYIDWLNNQLVGNNSEFEKKYKPIIDSEDKNKDKRPFLSIITRTQGRRPEMLREVFLTLMAQSDMDFEVVLIGHKLDDNQEKMVKNLLNEFPDILTSRVRFIKLDYGSRTTPLNIGFAHARGEYIAILDDDDIVYSNWVEEFHNAAKEYMGQVLHAYVITQEWITIETKRGYSALRTSGAPMDLYCRKFDFISQVDENYCPPVGLAFPAYTFQKLGIIFDEHLSTREDWDFLMRTAFFAGVHDIEVPTAMYRIWINAENSHTVHTEDIWAANFEDIHNKLKSMPLLIPAGGSALSVKSESMNLTKEQEPIKIPYQLFYCGNEGFSEEQSVVVYKEKGAFDIKYKLDGKIASKLRFDPGMKGKTLVSIDQMEICYIDGCHELVECQSIKTNGEVFNCNILFMKDDPQIVFKALNKPIDYVRIIGGYNILDCIVEMKNSSFVKKRFSRLFGR